VYFRKLENHKGADEVAAAMQTADHDEVKHKLKKYHDEKVHEFNTTLLMEYVLHKDAIEEIRTALNAWNADKANYDPALGVYTLGAVKGGLRIISSATTSVSDGDFMSQREFYLDLEADISAGEVFVPGSVDESTFSHIFQVVWRTKNDNGNYTLIKKNGGDEGLLKFLNKDMDQQKVVDAIEKHYHNLLALWIVLGVVGGLLIIGIICACLCC